MQTYGGAYLKIIDNQIYIGNRFLLISYPTASTITILNNKKMKYFIIRLYESTNLCRMIFLFLTIEVLLQWGIVNSLNGLLWGTLEEPKKLHIQT